MLPKLAVTEKKTKTHSGNFLARGNKTKGTLKVIIQITSMLDGESKQEEAKSFASNFYERHAHSLRLTALQKS